VDTVKLASVDVSIIRCLHGDARRSAASIAGELGIPESTVRHRLNRLVRRGIVEFATLTNPLQLGYQIWAIIEVQAELRKIRPVAQQLAAAPEVYFVGITTGGYDVLAAAVFRSNDELLDFITRRLSGIPGIVRTSTSSVLQVVKRTMTFPLPDTTARGREPRTARRRRKKGKTERTS
jgi:Lrp/AsnC family transcriptional regulator for asnA, asnC and gidA